MGKEKEMQGGREGKKEEGIERIGGRYEYLGKVEKENMGSVFENDISEKGVEFDKRKMEKGQKKESQMILVKKDGES